MWLFIQSTRTTVPVGNSDARQGSGTVAVTAGIQLRQSSADDRIAFTLATKTSSRVETATGCAVYKLRSTEGRSPVTSGHGYHEHPAIGNAAAGEALEFFFGAT